jgi:hypothetical protein
MTDDSQPTDDEPSRRPSDSVAPRSLPSLPPTVEDPDASASVSSWMRPPFETISSPPPPEWFTGPHEPVPWTEPDEFMITGPFGADTLEQSVKPPWAPQEPAPEAKPTPDAGEGDG